MRLCSYSFSSSSSSSSTVCWAAQRDLYVGRSGGIDSVVTQTPWEENSFSRTRTTTKDEDDLGFAFSSLSSCTINPHEP
jgi:hypothetical protein